MNVWLLVVWLAGMPMVMDAYTELDKCEAAASVQRAKPGRQAVCPVIRVVGFVDQSND